MSSSIHDWLLSLYKQPAKRGLYARIADSHVLDQDYSSSQIKPEAFYFEIRIAETFLSLHREHGRDFVPLTVVMSKFLYDGKRRDFPFIVGNELLSDLQPYVEGEHIVFRNTRVAGPIPYAGDDIGLFVGLYRVEVDSLVTRVLDFMSQVANVFDVARLSGYVDVADALTSGLRSVLDMKQLEKRIGHMDVFQDSGPKVFREGYLVYVNCEEQVLSVDQMWVKQGKLWVGPTRNSLQPLTKHDYCLAQIQAHPKRFDYTALPCHETWKKARSKIDSGEHALAHMLLIECCQQLAASPDLIPRHRDYLIRVYRARFGKALERYHSLHAIPVGGTPPSFRGASRIMNARESIQNTTYLAYEAGITKEALQGLIDLSENFDRLPVLDPDAELTNDDLIGDLSAIEGFDKAAEPNPDALVKALAIAAVTAT